MGLLLRVLLNRTVCKKRLCNNTELLLIAVIGCLHSCLLPPECIEHCGAHTY
jgi:hypothetical protein